MNERVLYENLKSFAAKNELKFESENTNHFHGVISQIKLMDGDNLLVQARISKTGSEFRQEWTKVFFIKNELPDVNLRIKNSFFNRFSKSSDLEKSIRNILKSLDANELNLSDSESVIRFNHILFEEDELKTAIDLKKTIKQVLTHES